MKSLSQNIEDWGRDIREILSGLERYSGVHRWHDSGRSAVFVMSGDFAWTELNTAGHKQQSLALEAYQQFSSVLELLLRNQPTGTLQEFSESKKRILQVIKQDDHLYDTDFGSQFEAARAGIDLQVSLIGRLYDASEGKVLVLPDTNALLYAPSLEDWGFENIDEFRIVLTPTVLSELDQLKVNYRSEEVRKKAEKIIRQIKEYRRRGSLTKGVPIKKGVSELVALATEPNAEKSLPWLDLSNNDDRIVARTIEVMRENPSAPVAIVTRDINLQNKAEFARIPFLEPPEPTPMPAA